MNYPADPNGRNDSRGYDCGQEESEAQGAETQQGCPQGNVPKGQPPPQEQQEIDQEGGPAAQRRAPPGPGAQRPEKGARPADPRGTGDPDAGFVGRVGASFGRRGADLRHGLGLRGRVEPLRRGAARRIEGPSPTRKRARDGPFASRTG